MAGPKWSESIFPDTDGLAGGSNDQKVRQRGRRALVKINGACFRRDQQGSCFCVEIRSKSPAEVPVGSAPVWATSENLAPEVLPLVLVQKTAYSSLLIQT